jgi:hypothetical protein
MVLIWEVNEMLLNISEEAIGKLYYDLLFSYKGESKKKIDIISFDFDGKAIDVEMSWN